MLSKPRTSTRDGHRWRMITPRHIGSSSCDLTLLKCEACQLAKQKSRHPWSKFSSNINELEGRLSQNILKPGQIISCDQYMSTTLGRQPHTFGREHNNKRLVGGTIFVDHATNFIFHNHQINLTSTETVRSKHLFEAALQDYGFITGEYIADNHPFKAKKWMADINHQQQKMNYSGVGAHHQNLSERHIQTIFNWS